MEKLYSIADDFRGPINPSILADKISADLTTALVGINVDGDDVRIVFEQPITTQESTALDGDQSNPAGGIIGAHSLSAAKDEKINAIDERTQELIFIGYEFPPSSGLVFSASPDMQRTLMGTMLVKGNPAMTYPITWSTSDNQNTIELPGAADVENFYLTGMAHVRGCKDSGTVLKSLVNACETVAEVYAIEDNR